MENKNKMNRRKFIKLTTIGAATTSMAALMVYSAKHFSTDSNSKAIALDAKKTFARCGACSHTFFYLLNREFGHPKGIEERASDPLAGGLMNKQQQCGMLWGSTLAVGAEAFRRFNNHDQAMAATITATQHLVKSFTKRAKSVNCLDIVGCDISNSIDVAEFMLKSLPGGFTNMLCMNLAEKWAPEAIQSAKVGLSKQQTNFIPMPVSCACEVARKMGANEQEIVTVAGFAGGIGLSGNACGALAAAIWLSSLKWCREHPEESGYSNPNSKAILKTFLKKTNSEMLCSKITGKCFESIADHSEFVKTGGCEQLINVLTTEYKMM